MSTAVILLAAGSGSRFKKSQSKQWISLAGMPILFHSLKTFQSIPWIKEIILVVPPREKIRYRRRLKQSKRNRKVTLAPGGTFRGESVRNGLKACSDNVATVLVHDCARPLVSRLTITRVAQAAKRYGVSLAAWPLPDTLKQVNGGERVKKTIPRKNLWCAQTPQGFRLSIAREVLSKPTRRATDDTELAEKKGYKVKIVLGEPQNFKVTYPFDLKTAAALLRKKV